MSASPPPTRILACVVLYRMSLEESPTLRTLAEHGATLPGIEQLGLLVADNSPEPHTIPSGFSGNYMHHPGNPGLALPYSRALDDAEVQGASWLLLLDQDTHLTREYLAELLELSQSLACREEIAAIVPKLTMAGRLMSPHHPRYPMGKFPLDLNSYGVLHDAVMVFNSGSLLRVSALKAIGGFPMNYPLDYLDHATFHALQRRGGRVFLMHARIEHELSESRTDVPPNLVRIEQRLHAEARYYKEFGTTSQYLGHRVDLMRQVIGHARRGRLREAMMRWRALFGRR